MTEWTVATLKEHFDALRQADQRALQLAREIQTYKDEKANELREQISSERGAYVTNKDLEPIKAYISSQMGRTGGIGVTLSSIVSTLVAVAALSSIVGAVLAFSLRAH
jgi:hypothetical protein